MTTAAYLDHILDYATGLSGIDPVSSLDGTVELRLGDDLLGYIYDNGLVDLNFGRHVRDQVLTEGRADRHHANPDSGWVSAWIRTPEDVRDVQWLLRLAYITRLAALPAETVIALAPGVDVMAAVTELDLSTPLRVLVTRPAVPAGTPSEPAL